MAEDKSANTNKEEVKVREAADATEFVELVKSVNPKLFANLDKTRRDQVISAISVGFTQVSKHHSGPLPDVETLQGYADIIPNGAERVMAMAEKEQSHRHHMEQKVSRRHLNQKSTGQWMGFILAAGSIASGFYLLFLGKNALGLGAIITPVVSLAAVFIVQKVTSKSK